jgi:uncharacterized protein YbjT (DUF2867 family)
VFNENLPLITAVGATSKQGRSTAHTLLASGRYRVRALTRNVDSPEARSLAAQGAELVAVPVEVGHTRELTRAFRGSHGVFLMTPMIVPPATHEFDLGKQLADAAVEAGVQHVIYSALENVDKITGGKKWVPHFTDKARVEEYIRGLPAQSSFVYPAFFYTSEQIAVRTSDPSLKVYVRRPSHVLRSSTRLLDWCLGQPRPTPSRKPGYDSAAPTQMAS